MHKIITIFLYILDMKTHTFGPRCFDTGYATPCFDTGYSSPCGKMCQWAQTFNNSETFEYSETTELRPCGWVDCHTVSKSSNTINGKKFPDLEKESIFPHRKKPSRKCLSVRKEHQRALTCPHRQKCLGYKHSCNTGHYATYSKDTCTIFGEAFHSGHAAGERLINDTIHAVAKNHSSLERLQIKIKVLLTETAKKPRTELNAWNLGVWHGAFLRLK
uniref:Uncharacterized protein n=1 Tax=Hypsela tridens TaxID=2010880 RepID=A0A1Z2QTL1_9ASTR|nr:hypothetical protein Hy_tri1Pt0117 [Hypsela tridens]ASA34823.1 hypothetical protein Hy_tri1Pt0117 [Hypsela tridens]